MKAAEARAALDALYAELPRVDCKGLCANTCGPVDMSDVERDRIHRRGVTIPPYTPSRGASWARGEGTETCPALTADRRCSVHDVRPMICRLWGVVRGPEMACPHGCTVTPGRLRHAEAMRYLAAAARIGGGTEFFAVLDQGFLDDNEVMAATRDVMRGVPGAPERLMALLRQRRGSADGATDCASP